MINPKKCIDIDMAISTPKILITVSNFENMSITTEETATVGRRKQEIHLSGSTLYKIHFTDVFKQSYVSLTC